MTLVHKDGKRVTLIKIYHNWFASSMCIVQSDRKNNNDTTMWGLRINHPPQQNVNSSFSIRINKIFLSRFSIVSSSIYYIFLYSKMSNIKSIQSSLADYELHQEKRSVLRPIHTERQRWCFGRNTLMSTDMFRQRGPDDAMTFENGFQIHSIAAADAWCKHNLKQWLFRVDLLLTN